MNRCRYFSRFGLLFVVTASAATLAGCPLLDLLRPAEFRSADIQRNMTRLDMIAFAPGAGAEEDAAPVREVTEPDIIRQQGRTLFILNQYRGLLTVDLDSMAVLAALPTTGFPRDLYIEGNRAFVLVSNAENLRIEDGLITHDLSSRLYIVDISDPAAPSLLGTANIGGDLFDSRLVGDVLYAVGAEYRWTYWGGGVDPWDGDAGVSDGSPGAVPGSDGVMKQQTGQTLVTSFNVAQPDEVVVTDQLAFDSPGDLIHVTPEALFVAAWQGSDTIIRKVDIGDPSGLMAPRGSVRIAGRVADRFKMDAWDGHLRVISRAFVEGEPRIFVSTVPLANPDALDVLAKTEFVTARGDQLFATRFEGPRAFVVTYFIVDPLYVVDLSDPANPVIQGELEVPGWSTHIEPRGDRLIALGVDDTNGWRASVSLFDVSDPTKPGLVQRVSFGDSWSWSSAFQDVKAFSVAGDRILVPFSGWNESGGYDRLQFVRWDRDGLEVQGFVDLEGAVLRSFDDTGRVLSVTSTQLAAIDSSDPAAPAIATAIPLAENTVDIVQTANGALASVLVPYRGGGVTVAVEGGGRVDARVGAFEAAFAHENSVVVVGVSYEERARYRVAFVDVRDPAAPALLDIVEAPIEPSFGYWWWGPGIGMPEIFAKDKRITADIWWPWWGGRRAYLTGDYLSLRGYAERWSDTIAAARPGEGLAVIDLRTREVARTIGLGYDRIESIDAAGDRLFLTTASGEASALGRPTVAYYLRTLDPATGEVGNAANVPGTFLDYDADRDLLLVEDYQWDSALSYGYERIVRSVAWSGSDRPRLLDSLAVPPNTLQTVAAGKRLYFDLSQDRGHALQPVDIGDDGAFTLLRPTPVSATYGWLLGADGFDAVVRVGSQGVARYDFTQPAEPLQAVLAVMGYPGNVRWAPDAVLLPLGYSGHLVLAR